PRFSQSPWSLVVVHSFPTRRSSDLPRLGFTITFFKGFSQTPPALGKLPFAPSPTFQLADKLSGVATIKCPTFSRFSNRSNSPFIDRKSTRLNSSHQIISYAVFCLKK